MLWTAGDIEAYFARLKSIQDPINCTVALWRTAKQTPLPLRWVLVRDPQKQFRLQSFFATDTSATPLEIVEWFVICWSEEVTLEEARAHLGMGTQRQWSKLAVERTTPVV